LGSEGQSGPVDFGHSDVSALTSQRTGTSCSKMTGDCTCRQLETSKLQVPDDFELPMTKLAAMLGCREQALVANDGSDELATGCGDHQLSLLGTSNRVLQRCNDSEGTKSNGVTQIHATPSLELSRVNAAVDAEPPRLHIEGSCGEDMWNSRQSVGVPSRDIIRSSCRQQQLHIPVFEQRSLEDLHTTVQRWKRFVHPRAFGYFEGPGVLERILATIANQIDKNDDPIDGPNEKCVLWHGNTKLLPKLQRPKQQRWRKRTQDYLNQQQAMFQIVKPGEDEESVVYINRILAFAFAAEESFTLLMRLPKQPFCMSCGNQLCIRAGHISTRP